MEEGVRGRGSRGRRGSKIKWSKREGKREWEGKEGVAVKQGRGGGARG